MIKKERTVSGFIVKLEALVRRMPEMEPGRERAISQLNKRRAGYSGEQKLDYYLNFLDEKSNGSITAFGFQMEVNFTRLIPCF